MSARLQPAVLFAIVIALFLAEGTLQNTFFSGSWNVALGLLNMALISAVMAIGVNLQWGFAGLFNIGVMGFVALGGLAAVLISEPPTTGAWGAGGYQVVLALVLGAATIVAAVLARSKLTGTTRTFTTLAILVGGFFLYRMVFDPAVGRIEAINPALEGNLGGLNLPILLAWPVGALIAAGAAWVIGKTALGLRSDYLAIATLGISEIVIAILKNEDWLARGVKNVIGLERPVPYEVDLQSDPGFVERASNIGMDPVLASTLYVKLNYTVMFTVVLVLLLVFAQLALKSPWGRMVQAIRDNETAARAMGKDVTKRHLQIFVLGSAIVGLAGAMMTTLEGSLIPTAYTPLRFTFLVWVMVIVGGSGNNFGAVLGGFVIWFLWIKVETWGLALLEFIALAIPDGSALEMHLLDSAPHMRLLTMGLVLLIVLRFSPRGLIPER